MAQTVRGYELALSATGGECAACVQVFVTPVTTSTCVQRASQRRRRASVAWVAQPDSMRAPTTHASGLQLPVRWRVASVQSRAGFALQAVGCQSAVNDSDWRFKRLPRPASPQTDRDLRKMQRASDSPGPGGFASRWQRAQ